MFIPKISEENLTKKGNFLTKRDKYVLIHWNFFSLHELLSLDKKEIERKRLRI